MNPEDQITKPEVELTELDMDSSESVDDFIKQLEEKERDLHITADLSIEIAEMDFDIEAVPDFVAAELVAPIVEKPIEKPKASESVARSSTYGLEAEVERLKKRVAELTVERTELQKSSDRRSKDFQNFKYRVDRERRGSFIDQIANLATQMLPVIDNLDRALESVESSKSKRSVEFQQFYEGIALVNNQVNEILAEMGVTPITAVGETFDPTFHEAVAIDENRELAPNTVSEEMLRGYRIGNKVIRHSMVKVTASASSSANVAATKDSAGLIDEADQNEFSDDSQISNDTSGQEVS